VRGRLKEAIDSIIDSNLQGEGVSRGILSKHGEGGKVWGKKRIKSDDRGSELVRREEVTAQC